MKTICEVLSVGTGEVVHTMAWQEHITDVLVHLLCAVAMAMDHVT